MKSQMPANVDSNCHKSRQFDKQYSKCGQNLHAQFLYMDQTFQKSPYCQDSKLRTVWGYNRVAAKRLSRTCYRSCIWYFSLVVAICSQVIVIVEFLPWPQWLVSENVFLPYFAATTSAIVPSHFPRKSCFFSLSEEQSYNRDLKSR